MSDGENQADVDKVLVSGESDRSSTGFEESNLDLDNRESGYQTFVRVTLTDWDQGISWLISDHMTNSEGEGDEMATGKEIDNVIKPMTLTGANDWKVWTSTILDFLELHDLKEYINETLSQDGAKKPKAVKKKNDIRARLIIKQCLDKKNLELVEGAASAHQMWSVLTAKYDKCGVTDAFSKFRSNMKYSRRQASDISTYCNFIR